MSLENYEHAYEYFWKIFSSDDFYDIIESYYRKERDKEVDGNYFEILDENLSLFEEIKNQNFTKNFVNKNDSNGVVEFLDRKNIVRYELEMHCCDDYNYDKYLDCVLIKETYKPQIISKQELLSIKGNLKKKNFIFKNDPCHIFYEDEHRAFELTSKSFFENEGDYELFGKVEFNLLLFKFTCSSYSFGGHWTHTTYTAVANLKSFEAIIVDTRVDYESI